MYGIRVFQKTVFLCNLCFVASCWLRTLQVESQGAQALVKTVVVLGFLLALPLNILLSLCLIWLLLWKKISFERLNRPLFVVNLLFLLLTTVYFLYL